MDAADQRKERQVHFSPTTLSGRQPLPTETGHDSADPLTTPSPWRSLLHLRRLRGSQPTYCLSRLRQTTKSVNFPMQAVSTNDLHPDKYLSRLKKGYSSSVKDGGAGPSLRGRGANHRGCCCPGSCSSLCETLLDQHAAACSIPSVHTYLSTTFSLLKYTPQALPCDYESGHPDQSPFATHIQLERNASACPPQYQPLQQRNQVQINGTPGEGDVSNLHTRERDEPDTEEKKTRLNLQRRETLAPSVTKDQRAIQLRRALDMTPMRWLEARHRDRNSPCLIEAHTAAGAF